MKIRPIQLATVVLLTWLYVARAAVFYVDVNSTNPMPPYATWSTAATNIQDAIGESTKGDLILVTNGVYTSGETLTGDGLTNRVALTNAVTLQSVNGADVTVIDGGGLMRCVYLGDGAMLTGFTLTNGHVFTGYIANGGGVCCVSTDSLVSSCLFISNYAIVGSGGYGGTFTNCIFTGNTTSGTGYGAGVAYGVLYDCMISNNVASGVGGGAWQSSLYGCMIANNAAGGDGGGVGNCTVANCMLTGNSAQVGGGVYESTALNSWINSSSSQVQGAGASYSTLNNCTIVGNFSDGIGAGTYFCTSVNCIVAYNQTPNGLSNFAGGTMSDCCTFPLPSSGSNNITADPALASLMYLSSDSPCRNAGSAMYASGVDIDDEEWSSPPSIGCDEYIAGSITGPLSAAMQITYSNFVAGFSGSFTAQINGRASMSLWDFGDGTTISNSPYVSHAWNNPGDYELALYVYNESNLGGISVTSTIHVVSQAVYYVDANGANPTPPYLSWNSAATNIQDALDAVSTAGALVLVTNGVYRSGGRQTSDGITNCVMVIKPVTVQSVNGSATTFIDGGHAMRCAYLTNGVFLAGFTLTNGYDLENGGGVCCMSANVLVSNCLLTGNSAVSGGGAYSGTLNDCILAGNGCSITSLSSGGGASGSVMNSCFLAGNWATNAGGGAVSCTLNNCFLAGNSANAGGAAANSTLYACVITNNFAFSLPGLGGNPFGGTPGVGGGVSASTLQGCLVVSNVAVNMVGGSAGGGAYNSTLINCTLRGNRADSGGGVYDGNGLELSDCILTGNWAYLSGGGFYGAPGVLPVLTGCLISGNGSGIGGGVYSARLINCLISGNCATNNAGGVYACGLYNCTDCLNSAANQGGGMWGSSAYNSIIYYNTAPVGPNWENGGGENYCCIWPNMGDDDITNAPLFVDLAAGDFHLLSNSPCINAGNNGFVYAGITDSDGDPRIVDGTVDIGAYEYQSPVSMISYAWLQQFGLPIGTNTDTTDSDGTGMNNWQKWIAGLNPTNPASVLAMLPLVATNNTVGITVTWQSVNTRMYYLQRATNLTVQSAFSTIQNNLVGQVGTTSFMDTSATNGGSYFYRVGVQ